jgi:DTW domain-containing protein YfiP
MSHAVSRLRAERLARSTKPFLARGGNALRCDDCRLPTVYCMCSMRRSVPSHAGMCLLMADIEPIKPSNTGWLIADIVPDTFAFSWARTEVNPALLQLLADPQWQPYVVFPAEFVDASRVVHTVDEASTKRPLFVLLDGTWAEARKMFRKSPYLNHLPILSLHPDQISRYRLRRSSREDHFCTAEVAALCLELSQDTSASHMLNAYLDLYSERYLLAKRNRVMPSTTVVQAHLQILISASQ